MFTNSPIDLVILDYAMPGKNGVEVADQMRALRADVPIIMLSACQMQPEDVNGQVDLYLRKGQNPGVLLREIKLLLKTPEIQAANDIPLDQPSFRKRA